LRSLSDMILLLWLTGNILSFCHIPALRRP